LYVSLLKQANHLLEMQLDQQGQKVREGKIMAVKTREAYLAALRKLRPNIYKFGELIEDVTTHPATKRTVESHARCFDAANDPDLEKMYTTTSIFTGDKIQRWNGMMQDHGALIQNMRFKRQNYRRTGSCTGAVCVGWNAMNVMWAVTQDMDAELGTAYQERLKNWILHAQKEGLTVAGALTDAKGDRSKPPSQQADPDTNLHVKEVREDGIVIRGAKLMICGTAAAQEIFLLPGSGYKDPDKDYAVACVVPRDIDGLTIVEARHPSDKRELEETADVEVPDTGITQGWLLFDDVFVPSERVFMCRRSQVLRQGDPALYFQLPGLHRRLCHRAGGRHDWGFDPDGAGQRLEDQDVHEQAGGHEHQQHDHLRAGCRGLRAGFPAFHQARFSQTPTRRTPTR
jgi:aromatic ring hydroxylase